jgi:hypothetical protein
MFSIYIILPAALMALELTASAEMSTRKYFWGLKGDPRLRLKASLPT